MNAEERARVLCYTYWLEARGFPDPHETAEKYVAAAIREAEREAYEAAAVAVENYRHDRPLGDEAHTELLGAVLLIRALKTP